ncbi:MAG: hypothetical protein PHC34_03630 [Candidatus Gastranaerophilales bacterium]|nr:hypothetical protein [Candidatus Gastranaerophilales bacterium]
MNKFIKNLHNYFDFWIRRHICLSRGNYYPSNEPKNGLFDQYKDERYIIASTKEKEYLERYQLQRLKDNSKKRIYLENLSIIEFFENYLNLKQANNELKILDIGSKNWFYAEGEYNFFKYNSFEKNIDLTGIEIDAYRLYTDLYSRYDYASYYIKNLKNANYIVGDLLLHKENYDYIIWFFPFVTKEPLLNWGLPLKFFKPQNMLEHTYSLLKPNGTLIIVNQGEEEYIEQENLIKELNIPYSKKGSFKSIFLDFSFGRYVTIIQKQ